MSNYSQDKIGEFRDKTDAPLVLDWIDEMLGHLKLNDSTEFERIRSYNSVGLVNMILSKQGQDCPLKMTETVQNSNMGDPTWR